MRKAVALSRFRGFQVGRRGVVVSHLQYADDTLCVGETTVENLWALKAILRGFELASGLKVNFWKSNIMGVNVSQDFMRLSSIFLNCRVGSIPFKYLGLPVGANPRKASTWEPLVQSLRKRLGGWTNRFVSLGGRITLLNSVLNAIPIFYLSFIKIPVKVWKSIKRIQREFLWGGRGGRRKINWVKWELVCQPKRSGGLGVRDIRAVNISLLAKWRWRLLTKENSLWQQVIIGKYGDSVLGRVEMGEDCKPWFSSSWWRDICSIGINLDRNWFSLGVAKNLGNGGSTRFWEDIWVGEVSLQQRFPQLFLISVQQDTTIASVWNSNEIPGWNLRWRRRLFEWELNLLNELLLLLSSVSLTNVEDSWYWKPAEEKVFTVKSAYDLVSDLMLSKEDFSFGQKLAFKVVWKSPAPSKTAGFAWLVLLDRVPTKANLFRRQVIRGVEEQCCVFCRREVETASHLFLYCNGIMQVWDRVFCWLGMKFSLPHSNTSMLNLLASTSGSKQTRRGMVLIWISMIWMV
jgi:hypothetical protein